MLIKKAMKCHARVIYKISLSLLTISQLLPGRAATLTVSSTADSGAGTRQSLAIATDGDTIDATELVGTVLLTNGELIVGKSVTLLGPGPANLALDGNAMSRVFHVLPNKTVMISGLTIINADNEFGRDPELGGGIYNENATLLVSNCTIIGTIYGSGIFNAGGTGAPGFLTLVDCNFIANHGGGSGGVWNLGSANVRHCLFANNSGASGGGLANDGKAVIANSTFIGNLGSFMGGGVYNDGVLLITESSVQQHSTKRF